MKIVHLYKDYFPPTVGGIEQTVERMARLSLQRGADVTVIASHPGMTQSIEEVVNGVKVIRCAEWSRVWSTPFCPSMPRALARMDADIFHLHYPSPPGEVSWLMTRPKGAAVLTWHSDIVRQKAVLPIYGHLIKAMLQRAQLIMTSFDGQAEASPFLRHYPSKVRTVPLGIDLEHYRVAPEAHPEIYSPFGPGDPGPVVLFVGRLVVSKGLSVLLEAASNIQGRLLIVGDGPDMNHLRDTCRLKGLENKVYFTGKVSPEKVKHFISLATVGVLPSLYESYGLAMVEIMSNGIPMVCTDLGTGTTFVNRHEETGLAVPPNDSNALAEAINRLLQDHALRMRLGLNARDRSKRLFSTEAMMNGVFRVYEEAIELKRSRNSKVT